MEEEKDGRRRREKRGREEGGVGEVRGRKKEGEVEERCWGEGDAGEEEGLARKRGRERWMEKEEVEEEGKRVRKETLGERRWQGRMERRIRTGQNKSGDWKIISLS